MKLWRLADPRDFRFAEVGGRGTWVATEETEEGVCPSCGASRQQRVQPLVIEWLRGPAELGDFTWAGRSPVVVDRAFAELSESFSGFESGPVAAVNERKRFSVKQQRDRGLSLPELDPPLHELWVTTRVHLDAQRSTVDHENHCEVCGCDRWRVHGVERWDSQYDREKKKLVRVRTERVPNSGIYLHETDLGGADIFRVVETPVSVFCTDRVRAMIEREKFSNVSFLEMGEIL